MESAGLKGSMEELGISFLFLFLFYFCHRACRILGEGNGNPLQYSCLENPRDGGVGCCLWGRTESDTTEAT